jgi:hypothetical protein
MSKYYTHQSGCAVTWGMALRPKVAGSVPHRVIDLRFNSHHGPGLDLASNRNEYQGFLLRVKAAGAYDWQTCHIHVPIV